MLHFACKIKFTDLKHKSIISGMRGKGRWECETGDFKKTYKWLFSCLLKFYLVSRSSLKLVCMTCITELGWTVCKTCFAFLQWSFFELCWGFSGFYLGHNWEILWTHFNRGVFCTEEWDLRILETPMWDFFCLYLLYASVHLNIVKCFSLSTLT